MSLTVANWKALTWSESITTGKQAARHVLTVLCLKCDDEYRVFSDATRLAGFCEISTRRLYGWRDYLEEHGFITVIRRVRANGSEAKPITLLNVPDAPHLNDTPVVLDYHGKHLYPRDPYELHAAGIRWISGNEVGRVHPSHEPIQGDDSSGCQHDSSSGCTNCTEGDSSQLNQRDDSSGCQHDDLSPHGDDDLSPPNQSPREISPTNYAPEHESAADTGGWLVEDSPNDKQDAAASEADSPGASLLRSIGIVGKALAEWSATVTTALDQFGEREVRETLLGGRERPRTGAIITTRLPQLGERLCVANTSGAGSSAVAEFPVWCGECEEGPRLTRDGRKCRTCHPRYAVKAA